MFNLVQPIFRNTSRIVLDQRMFQHRLRILYSFLFVTDIFTPVGVYLIKARYAWGAMERFVQFYFCDHIFQVEFFE